MEEKCRSQESGQALVTVVISLLVLLLFAALAVDVGQFYTQRRHMQNAADAGALAGARELCLGRTSEQAIVVANDYGGTRNGAPIVTSTVASNIVVVTTTIPVASFFARLIGIANVDVHAVAKAACGPATTGCGIFPLAFDINVFNNLLCPIEFYVFAEDNDKITDDFCLNCDCVAAFKGKGQLAPGHRGWLALSPAGPPYNDFWCPKDLCGANELNCMIEHGWPGQVKVGECFPSNPGVKASYVSSVDIRAATNPTVTIVLWDPTKPQACDQTNIIGSCNKTPYEVAGFGCVVLNPSETVNFDLLPNPLDPKFVCPKNVKVIKVSKPCNCPSTTCGATGGGSWVPGGVNAVSLIE